MLSHRALITLALMALAAGCSNESEKAAETGPEAEVHDVQYYLDNEQVRKTTLRECQDSPGTLEDTPNCVNAIEAAKQARRQKMRDAINKG